jgi:hypothetical protein
MKHSLILLLFIITLSKLHAQITFEHIYDAGTFNSVVELQDHTFILCGPDSVSHGAIFQMDKYGNIDTSYYPTLRGDYLSINDIKPDTISNGFAICGSATDTSGGNSTGYYLLVDSQFQNLDVMYYSGGITGPNGISILRTSTNDYIVGTETWQGVGNYTSEAHKIIYSGTGSWSAGGGSNLSSNGMDIDANDNFLIAGFSWTGAFSASVGLFNSAGSNLQNFDITDTAYGNSQVFESCAAVGPNETYLFGVDLNPNSTNYALPYINCLDTSFNVLWQKYLDWGFNVNLIGMKRTMDSCIVYLLGTDNGLALYKVNANGDSLWTQFHNRSTTGLGIRFAECSDRGYMIVGTWSDSLFISHQYVLKTDSLGRLLPPATITVTGNSIVCPGDSINLSAPSGYSYLWSTGDTAQSIYVIQPGNYTVQVTDSNSLTALSDTFNFGNYFVTIPVITLSGQNLLVTVSGTYQWYVDNTLIPGAVDSIYDPVSDGSYQIEVVDSNGCTTMSGLFIITAIYETNAGTSIFNFAEKIEVKNSNGIDHVEVFDSTGKLVLSKKIRSDFASVSLSGLTKGVYIVLAVDYSGRVSRKLIEKN